MKRITQTQALALYQRYQNGESSFKLADEIGYNRGSLRNRWYKMKLQMRSAGESSLLAWHGYSAEKRSHVVAAAHIAAKLRDIPLKERFERAQSRYLRQAGIGPHENKFLKLLRAKVVEFHQQYPVSQFNVDFYLPQYNLAVEIVTGGGNKHVARSRKYRTKTILRKHNLLEIRLGRRPGRRILTRASVIELLNWGKIVAKSSGLHKRIQANGQPSPSFQRRPKYKHNSDAEGAQSLRS